MVVGGGYNPQKFWNEKARGAGNDPLAAVCYRNPIDNRIIDRVQRRMIKRVFGVLAKKADFSNKSLLDYGCGIGRWAAYFKSLGFGYCGVDLASEMIAMAASYHAQTDFRALENCKIPYGDASFDVICSIAVIHHNPYDAQLEIIDELLRVLKPDGYLVLFESIANPDINNPLEFPRPLKDWIAIMFARGMKCLWFSGTRYFATRDITGKLFGPRLFKNVATRIGSLLDPYMGERLPVRLQTRGAILFQRDTAPGIRRPCVNV